MVLVTCHHDAMSPFSPLSLKGRIAPLPFAVATIAVYVLSLSSQTLLASPVTVRLNVAPFVLAQAALIWLWLVVHVRRLRDAGRPVGSAFAIAIIYALEVALFAIFIWLMLESGGGGGGGARGGATILELFLILYLLGTLSSNSLLQVWVIGIVVLMLVPVVISLIFSIWVGTRQAVQAHSP